MGLILLAVVFLAIMGLLAWRFIDRTTSRNMLFLAGVLCALFLLALVLLFLGSLTS